MQSSLGEQTTQALHIWQLEGTQREWGWREWPDRPIHSILSSGSRATAITRLAVSALPMLNKTGHVDEKWGLQSLRKKQFLSQLKDVFSCFFVGSGVSHRQVVLDLLLPVALFLQVHQKIPKY